jgi:hypothetical protein
MTKMSDAKLQIDPDVLDRSTGLQTATTIDCTTSVAVEQNCVSFWGVDHEQDQARAAARAEPAVEQRFFA